MKCSALLYDFREGARRDYGDRAAAAFAKHNGIPAKGGRCRCETCKAGKRGINATEFIAPRQLELGPRGVQAQVVEAYEKAGCIVARLAQSYRRGARRNPGTPGIPDLYVFPPLHKDRRYPLAEAPMLQPWWHETKRLGGKQLLEQKSWQLGCLARGVDCVLGGVADAVAQMRKVGLVA